MIEELNKKIDEIQELDWVDEAFIDDDCVFEGSLSINLILKEDKIKQVCEELGYSTEGWDE